MFAKVLILALAAAVNCQFYNNYYNTGLYGAGVGASGIPVYKTSAHYGNLYGANGWGYGANLGRVAGIGALRTTGAIVGSGALGYGTGALIAGAPAVGHYGMGAHTYGTYDHMPHMNIARGVSIHQAGPINAAVQTISRTVYYKPVPYSGEPATVQDIDVPPQESPLRINFQSKSSPLAVTQQHIPAEPGQVQVTQSEDEPQTAVHNVHRPVIQQVNEVIQPYRSLSQVVEPVIEQTHTNIAQGEGVKLTGLTSGIVGGTGVLAASGVGVAGHPVAVPAVPAVAHGYKHAGLYGLGHHTGLYNAGHYNTGLYNNAGYYNTGLYGAKTYGTGLGYGYGHGLGARPYGHGYGYGTGFGLNGLSGLSTYGTTAQIAKY